jgi:hypothetical protein
MARRGFSCPNCRTWFEGQGNHPKCPLCGTRASPRDLLEARPPAAAPSDESSWALPDFEAPPAAPDYEEAPDFEEVRDYEVAPEPGDAEPGQTAEPRRGGDSESAWGNRFSPLIGALVFLFIIASQVCRALTEE